MAVGIGAYGLAIFTSVLTFIVLRLLRPVSKTIGHWERGEKEEED
jgi:uncharacterized membrane protein YhiD involved in acid resistance